MLTTGFSQKAAFKKGKALGVGFFLTDFEAASTLRNFGAVELFKNNNFFNSSNFHPGFSVNYFQGLTNNMDFAGSLGASFLKYPNENLKAQAGDAFYLEGIGSVNLKLMSDRYFFTPFIDLGVGVNKFANEFAAFMPAGVGFQFNFGDMAFMHIKSQYRIPVTDKASYHFQHSIGFAGNISPRKEAPVKQVDIPVVSDRDGDGVIDSEDRCPDEPGLVALKGCPDRDGDGIADIDDKCPDEPGVAKYGGCPIPDSDGDGINDEVDKCPNVPGVARYNGCPIPDSDGDGVNDEEDRCPNEVGPASNFGCPVIDEQVVAKVNKAAENVFFQTNSYKLLAKSFTSLKEVVQVMHDNPSFKISIDGYTDNTGRAEYNQTLSEQRAGSVRQYLIDQGIAESRITSAGHGINNPIADNNTAAGRAKNRRVEMKLSNY